MMVRLSALLCCALLVGCVGPYTSVVTVRHAEKQSGVSDPGLTAAGQRRADALRDHLADARANIVAVYSTDTRRTRNTAAPTAQSLGVPVRIYSSPEQLAARIRAEHAGEAVLVVAHSNTLGLIVDAFGADRPAAIPGTISENDYDNMVTVIVNGRGAAGAVHTTYGEESP
ncbi:MAG: histidine phosphatase family protein [Gammaproteobacteria bacterium]